MAFGNATFSNAAGAVSDIFAGQATAAGLRLKSAGDIAEAGNYDLAEKLARRNADYTETSTAIKDMQAQREIYKGTGATLADVAGSGFKMSGSALDLLREGAGQGALTKQVLGEQGQIQEAGFEEQAASYKSMAEAARYAASVESEQADKSERNGWITGGIKGAASVASLFI